MSLRVNRSFRPQRLHSSPFKCTLFKNPFALLFGLCAGVLLTKLLSTPIQVNKALQSNQANLNSIQTTPLKSLSIHNSAIPLNNSQLLQLQHLLNHQQKQQQAFDDGRELTPEEHIERFHPELIDPTINTEPISDEHSTIGQLQLSPQAASQIENQLNNQSLTELAENENIEAVPPVTYPESSSIRNQNGVTARYLSGNGATENINFENRLSSSETKVLHANKLENWKPIPILVPKKTPTIKSNNLNTGSWNKEGNKYNAPPNLNLEPTTRRISNSAEEQSQSYHVSEVVTKSVQNGSATISYTDVTKAAWTISDYLRFTNRTTINFMHFHKTGGVSFKTALFRFFANKTKAHGRKVHIRESCYKRTAQQDGMPTFVNWRCDWLPVQELNKHERNKLDVVFGHQYRVHGIESLLTERDVRSFTIMRHPFDRKISFFFHFFVRELGRSEEDVPFEEVRDFLLNMKLKDEQAELGKEVGPNYMAGRLLSDRKIGFIKHGTHEYFDVPQERKDEVSRQCIEIIRKYSFVGLQSESQAAMCMLKKMIQNFNDIMGIDNAKTEKIATTAAVLNTGAYSLTAQKIWNQFSEEDRKVFNQNEKVDLAIYEEGEKLFKRQVFVFGCGDHVKDRKFFE